MTLEHVVCQSLAAFILSPAWVIPRALGNHAQKGWSGEDMPPGMTRGSAHGEYIWGKDKAVMVYVAPGAFRMGSDLESPPVVYKQDQHPEHSVDLSGYYIDKYEVSVGQFSVFVREAMYKTTAEGAGSSMIVRPGSAAAEQGRSWSSPGFDQTDDHPVVCVSWIDAKKYAEWSGKSLPSEAQWEKAAGWDPLANRRGAYSWGDAAPAGRGAGKKDLDRVGNFADVNWGRLLPDGAFYKENLLSLDWGGLYDDWYVYTAPVGKYLLGKSPCGAYDMCGNVWEWCADYYQEDYYRKSGAKDPVNEDQGEKCVARGGSYDCFCTMPPPVTFRQPMDPKVASSNIGFRTALRGL